MTTRTPSRALYAGSFDPITLGHLDVLGKALRTFDEVYLSIGRNPKKTRMFDDREAMSLLVQSMQDHFGFQGKWTMTSDKDTWTDTAVNPGCPVTVTSYRGTVIDHAKEVGATHIVRGLRQVGDFNDEFTLTGVAGHLDPGLIFTHFICSEEFLHISSSTARELASYKSDISWLVTPSVEEALKRKFK